MTRWIIIFAILFSIPVFTSAAQDFGEELPRSRCILDLTVAYIGGIGYLGDLDGTINVTVNTYKEISGAFDRVCYGDILWLTRVVLGNVDLSDYTPTDIVGVYEKILDELQ